MPIAEDAMLEVDELVTRFHLKRGKLTVVDRVSFRIEPGETFGLVGESGCGKTVTARSILRLIPIPPGEIANGKIIFAGEDLLRKSPREMRAIRGKRIGMVFQEPMSALNPVFPVSTQIADGLRNNLGLSAEGLVSGSSSSCAWSASPPRRGGWTTTSTSSAVACASV